MYGLLQPTYVGWVLIKTRMRSSYMNNLNVVWVDLAKNIIQVSVVTPTMKELQNKALARKKFAEFLARQKPSLVAFESFATAHYWSRMARQRGHTARIIPAKAVRAGR